MSFDAPQSRNEAILQNILGAENVLVPAQSEIEAILLAILNDTSYSLEGRSRIARLLIAIKNNGTWDELPCISRNEEILYCILNGEAYQGETYSRNEELLKQWSESHATYEKTVTGNPIHVTDAVEESALALSVAFEPTQEATPFVGDTTTEPYLSKTAVTTGNKRYLDKIVGGTVAWNQLVQNGDFSDGTNHWNAGLDYITISAANNILTVEKTGGTTSTGASQKGDVLANHVYLCTAEAKIVSGTGFQIRYMGLTSYNAINSENWMKANQIVKPNNSGTNINLVYIRYSSTNTGTANVRNVNITDLTLMFGSTIADYIYSLEQAEAGAGVQWLKDYGFIDDTYRAYNAGELISTRPEGIQYGDVTTTFGSAITLRGIYRLSATTHKLYCTGDELTPDGTRTTKWSIYDLGTRTWNATSTYFWCDISSKKNGLTNLICSKYLTSSDGEDKTIKGFSTTSRIAIYDSSYSLSDTAAFKAAMSGVYVLVERETPTTSASETYPNPVTIANGDTEAFIDTRSIPLPVGNNSHYAGEYAVQGKTGLTVKHAQTQEDTPTTYSVIFTEQGTVYGGVIDIVTGALSITWGYIASYNGETLTGRWISSLDAYSEGGTPTTGAEVAYELASPITAQLTPQQVDMLLGENTVWTDNASDSISLTYIGTNPAVQLLAGLRKNSNNAKMVKLLKGGLKDAEIIRK